MKKVTLAASGIVLLSVGFIFGGGYGWHLMDERCGVLVSTVAPANNSYSLEKHLAALDALESGDVAKAKEIIYKAARLEVLSIRECKENSTCAKLTSTQLASDSSLNRITNLNKP